MIHSQQVVTDPEVRAVVARIMRRATVSRHPHGTNTKKRFDAIEEGLYAAMHETFSGKLTIYELERFERTMTSFLTKLED